MNRKHFLSSVLLSGASLPLMGNPLDPEGPDPDKITIRPKYLKQGDMIGITCPAGYISADELKPALQQLQNWGFAVRLGDTIGKRDFTFGGTDMERIADFQKMLDDPAVKAILCARGGYGSVRIIDALNFRSFLKHPKWIIGFSDITVLHSHLNRNYRVASIHSKMCNSFPDDTAKLEPGQMDSILSIRQALTGERIKYPMAPNINNRKGVASGPLIGGNLKTIESLAGTASDIHTAGKILFIEDTGEYLYSIDRMCWNLKRTGKLSGLKGLIVGGFNIKPDDPGEEFGRTLYDIVLEKVRGYSYPVFFDFPVGHQKVNYALKCGLRHRLTVKENECSLIELI